MCILSCECDVSEQREQRGLRELMSRVSRVSRMSRVSVVRKLVASWIWSINDKV
jgi:hypothetical protein